MKMNFLNKLILFFYIFYPLSTIQAQNITKETGEALDEIGYKMVKATLAGEYLSLIDYYTEDVIVKPDFIPTISGKKALLDQYKEDMKVGVKHHSFTGTVEKRWQHGDEIFERGTFGMAVSSKKSRRPMAFYGSYFQIWRRQSDGSFKISYVIWNLDFNPCESQ